jgi:S-adenosylmethionine synthetase
MVKLFSSESVTEGHPDKMCDKIADAILDEYIRKDKYSRVACEVMATGNIIFITGEFASEATVDHEEIARRVVREIGYEDEKNSIDWRTCRIEKHIKEQSRDIAIGVIKGEDIGAGDQGTMFGYAVDETEELMPLSIMLAHKIVKTVSEKRKSGQAPFLRPDGKSQVTIEYENGKPKRVHTVVVSVQHSEEYSSEQNQKKLKEFIIEEVIKKVIPAELLINTRFFINPTGRFVIGGPLGDAGLTGRKIVVDTYGGHSRHGGGAFSGKDPTKVDRSANYMARRIAKTIVASGIAKKCEVNLTYVIGVSDPVHITVETFGTSKVPEEKIQKLVHEIFPLRPKEIIEFLDLRRPIYEKTATYGHFGREDDDFTWEKLNQEEVEMFRALLKNYKRSKKRA